MSRILITGANGFLGSHCVAAALARGFSVNATVRSHDKEKDVRDLFGSGATDMLKFFYADLRNAAGWDEAVSGCEYVLHVASPMPEDGTGDAGELITAACDGVVHVLRAAMRAGVKRTVVTSSVAAIAYGKKEEDGPFDENSWADSDGADTQAFIRSKIAAERAAWSVVAADARGMELTVINPVDIFGPVESPETSPPIGLVKALLAGAYPSAPGMYFGIVDVRDLADLHITALLHPDAAGERFIARADDASYSVLDISLMLREGLDGPASRVPQAEMSDEEVRRLALRDPLLAALLPQLGRRNPATGAKARFQLGFSPRAVFRTIVDPGRSLLDLRLPK